jgi:hypothetical protein
MKCLLTLVEMFLAFHSFREREAAEKKKKEEEGKRNREGKGNDKEVIHSGYHSCIGDSMNRCSLECSLSPNH